MPNNEVVTNTNPVLPTRSTKPHDDKLSLLTIITLILGLITLLSLVLVLKVRKGDTFIPASDNSDSEVVEDVMEKEEPISDDDELGRKQLLRDLDGLKIDDILDSYTEEALDEMLY